MGVGFADELSQVSTEVVVHEGIDDRVGDVVGEVEVEDGGVPRQPLQRHKEPRGDSNPVLLSRPSKNSRLTPKPWRLGFETKSETLAIRS